MSAPIQFPQEPASNKARELVTQFEPRTLRTYTPTQAVLSHSAGVFHWTPEGRRLFDFSSGVLVANLGHNPSAWMEHFVHYLKWEGNPWDHGDEFFDGLPLTAYNAVTEVESEATHRLIDLLQRCPGGKRMEQVMWGASGSEAIQKALWAALARDQSRNMIIATRYGFHGKKGLAGACTGSETDSERDPRVRFISFPMQECIDLEMRNAKFDPQPYRDELEALKRQFGRRLGVLITEPYLGGSGSYHPPKAYLQMLQEFCQENDILFILDEVQSNFGRTGNLFAFETYGLTPDVVVLGKGLGNGVPVAAAVGKRELFQTLDYGEGSDTWSANPLCCAGVLATLHEFAESDVMAHCRQSSAVIEKGLVDLKKLPFVSHVRGEEGGMVWGLEMNDHAGRSGEDWANAAVIRCYQGNDGVGIHLLGPLAKKVLRIAPPLVITEVQARESMNVIRDCLESLLEPSMAESPASAGV